MSNAVSKVAYRLKTGHMSTAYIDLDDHAAEVGKIYTGTDKYSDEPVRVWWTSKEWVEN